MVMFGSQNKSFFLCWSAYCFLMTFLNVTDNNQSHFGGDPDHRLDFCDGFLWDGVILILLPWGNSYSNNFVTVYCRVKSSNDPERVTHAWERFIAH